MRIKIRRLISFVSAIRKAINHIVRRLTVLDIQHTNRFNVSLIEKTWTDIRIYSYRLI